MFRRSGTSYYVPAEHLISNSFLNSAQLITQFGDFRNNLRLYSSAPELVFERLVANLSEAFKTVLEREKQQHATAHPTCQSCRHPPEQHMKKAEPNTPQQKAKQPDQASERSNPPPYQNHAIVSTTRNAVIAPPPKGPGIGTFSTLELRPSHPPRTSNRKTATFEEPYRYPPHIVIGLSAVNIGEGSNARIKCIARRVDKENFDVHLDSWADTRLYSAGCAWMEIDQDKYMFEEPPYFHIGTYDTLDDHPWNEPQQQNSRKFEFYEPYPSIPSVVVWLTAFDINNDKRLRIKTFVTDVTTTGFTIHIDTWGDSVLHSGKATWVAHEPDTEGLYSGSFGTLDFRSSETPQMHNSQYQRFGNNTFRAPPRVLLAINSFDIDQDCDLRLLVKASSVTAAGMWWHLDAWEDTLLYSAGASYIAVS